MKQNEKSLWPTVKSALDSNAKRGEDLRSHVESILDTLTTEQKVAQLIQAELASVTPDDVREICVGALLNGGGVFPHANKHASREDWRNLANAFRSAAIESAAGIPLLWGTDAVHGHNNLFGATLFPHNIALGAASDDELMTRIGVATAQDVVDSGVDWVFAPTLAVPCDYRWGRTYEGFSQDPEVVGKLGAALTHGLQGDPESHQFLDSSHVLATSKHFVGEGATHDGVDQGNVSISECELREIHAQGHVQVLTAGAQVVMAAFNSWHNRKVHGSSYLLQDVLKDQMRFKGFVVSDWDGFAQIDEDLGKACSTAINAGVDMLMVSADWRGVYTHLLGAVNSGAIAKTRLDDAVRRILRVKALKGLVPSPTDKSSTEKSEISRASCESVEALAREAVRKSLVLLKNEGQVLPLNRSQRVLLVGEAADNISKQCGGWSLTWQGADNTNADFPNATSIAEGIRHLVESAGGSLDLTDEVGSATSADVAIVVFGEDPYAEGEGDLNHLSFSADQPAPLENMRRLRAKGIPVVALFLTGRPRWVNPEMNAADAFVVCWLPGTEGGAVADVLFRCSGGAVDQDFQGRLPFSWPLASTETRNDRNASDHGLHFPVGFGLTYGEETEFCALSETDETTGSAQRGPAYQGSYNYPSA